MVWGQGADRNHEILFVTRQLAFSISTTWFSQITADDDRFVQSAELKSPTKGLWLPDQRKSRSITV